MKNSGCNRPAVFRKAHGNMVIQEILEKYQRRCSLLTHLLASQLQVFLKRSPVNVALLDLTSIYSMSTFQNKSRWLLQEF